jgi:GNAT superfamily N-acetyltransferase
VLRQATTDDADAIAAVLTAARAAQPWFPPDLHTPDENRWFVSELLLPTHEVWVAEEDGRVVGFIGVKEDVLGHIFVHPDAQGRGVGTELLEKTKELRPAGFTLWTHQPSEARSFYERRGLVPIRFTDGATNTERIPDVQYAWTPESAAR